MEEDKSLTISEGPERTEDTQLESKSEAAVPAPEAENALPSEEEAKMPIALAARDITKRLAGGKKLGPLSMILRRGTLTILLGEREDEKTALLDLLSGRAQPDQGELEMMGAMQRLKNPKRAREWGIARIEPICHFLEHLTIIDNIILLGGGAKAPFLRKKEHKECLRKIMERFSLQVNLDQYAGDASPWQLFQAQLLLHLSMGADLFLVSDCTAWMTPQQKQRQASMLRSMIAEGHAVLLSVRQAQDAPEAGGPVYCLRKGQLSLQRSGTEDESSLEAAKDQPETEASEKTRHTPRGTVLEVRNLSVKGNRTRLGLRNTSLRVRRGECVGVHGTCGEGQGTLLRVLTGNIHRISGQVFVGGVDMTGASLEEWRDCGVGILRAPGVPEAGIDTWTWLENSILDKRQNIRFSPQGILNLQVAREWAMTRAKQAGVPRDVVWEEWQAFSPARKQRLALARILGNEPELVIAICPTQGLEASAREAIHGALDDLQKKGKAILLFSDDVEELLARSSRILLFRQGEIAQEMDIAFCDASRLGEAIEGGAPHAQPS